MGVCEQELSDTRPLERQPTIPFDKLLQAVAFGSTDPDILSSLASRLVRLNRQLGKPEHQAIEKASGGIPLHVLAANLIAALDLDRQSDAAREEADLSATAEPSPELITKAAEKLRKEAVALLVANPALREQLIAIRKHFEQTIDNVSKGVVLEAAFSEAARERARGLVRSFEEFLHQHRDEITALQVLYSQPYAQRLRFSDIKALAEAIAAPPRSWTPEVLWHAYETLDQSKVKGSGGRMLTDIVALVRFALHQADELEPFAEGVEERFRQWLAQQQNKGKQFTEEQLRRLVLIRNHIAANLGIEMDDFDYAPFTQKGGAGKVYQVFGKEFGGLLEELNEVLAA